MKMVHAITNGEDPSEISVGGGDERKLSQIKSSNIGKMGSVDKNSRAAELQKMINANKKLAQKLN